MYIYIWLYKDSQILWNENSDPLLESGATLMWSNIIYHFIQCCSASGITSFIITVCKFVREIRSDKGKNLFFNFQAHQTSTV